MKMANLWHVRPPPTTAHSAARGVAGADAARCLRYRMTVHVRRQARAAMVFRDGTSEFCARPGERFSGGYCAVKPIILGLPDGKLHAAPTLVALGLNCFKHHGLEVEAMNAGAHTRSIPAIANNEVDVSPQGPLLGFCQAWDPAHPMVMVADQGSVKPGRGEGAIVARTALLESGQLRDYPDLKGKRIGLSAIRGDHDWLTFNAALRKGGLSLDDVEIVICDFGEQRHRALAEGRIDAATVSRLGSQMRGREDRAFGIWKREHEFRERQERAITFSHRFWTERPDDGYRFVRAYIEGLRDYYSAFERGLNRDEIVRVLAAQAGEPEEAIATEMVPMAVDPNGRINDKAIASDITWFQEQGLLDHPIPIDQLIDYRYLDAALQDLGIAE
ncbi:MAG: hypothetical protein GEU73_01160 [Chloroflexi bacterium]|nr:hypothetical protein [Chloroflexota bacterium]